MAGLTEEDRAAKIASLERELKGYERRNLPDRVEAVKASLRFYGAKLPGDAAEKRSPKPKRSRSTTKKEG